MRTGIPLISLLTLLFSRTAQGDTLQAGDYTQLCSGIVTYDYYLPTGYTAAAINTAVLAATSSPYLPLLPNACQVAIKKLVCASAYLQSGVSYGGNLPFIRPCTSLCTATTAAGVCGGLLEAFGMQNDCTATSTATGLPVYSDGTNDVCNDMSSATVLIQSTKEPYLGTQCTGISADIFVPSGPAVDVSIAPMQQPYVMQTIVEAAVTAKLAQLPVYLDETCQSASKKLVCGVAFMVPQVQPVAAAIGLGELYLPQYPARSVCETYNTACAEFIATAQVTQGLNLTQDCDMHTSAAAGGYLQYPSSTQFLSGDVSGGLGLYLTTEPNTLDTYTPATTDPVCPTGFVIPEDPDRKGVIWVPGSGCAAACPRPMFTQTEYQHQETAARIIQSISVFLGVYMAITWTIFENLRKQYFVRMFINYSASISVFLCIGWMLPKARNYEERFCSTNATPSLLEDGGYCAAQGFVVQFIALAQSFAWLCVAVSTWIKVHHPRMRIEKYYHWTAAAVVFLTLICNTIPRAILKVPGYDGFSPYCLNEYDVKTAVTYGCLYSEIILIILIAAGCVIHIMRTAWRVRKRSLSDHDNKYIELLEVVRTPILFLFLFLFIWVLLIAVQINVDVMKDFAATGLYNWTACIFANFNGDNATSTGVCGAYPSDRIDPTNLTLIVITAYGQSTLTFIAFGAKSSVFKLWGDLLGVTKYFVKNPAEKMNSRGALKSAATPPKSRWVVSEANSATSAAQSPVPVSPIPTDRV